MFASNVYFSLLGISHTSLPLYKSCNFCTIFIIWQKLCLKYLKILKLMLFSPRNSLTFPPFNREHKEPNALIWSEIELGQCWVTALAVILGVLLMSNLFCFRPLSSVGYFLPSSAKLQEASLCLSSLIRHLPHHPSSQNASCGEHWPLLWNFSRLQYITPTHTVIKRFSNFTFP